MKVNICTAAILVLIAVSGCGYAVKDPTVLTNTTLNRSAFEEVKLISTEIDLPTDKRSFKQSTYSIDWQSRLLVRVSNLKDIDAQLLDNYPVLLRIKVLEPSSQGFAMEHLSVCPILTNWMMMATWDKAHPYRNGDWIRPGGDFDGTLCSKGMTDAEIQTLNAEEKAICDLDDVVCIDLRKILKEQYRVNRSNYGLMIMNESDEFVSIYGEGSSYQPLLIWRKLN